MNKKLIDYEGFEAYAKGVREKYALKQDVITPQERTQLKLHSEGYVLSSVHEISFLLFCLVVNMAGFFKKKRGGFFSFIDEMVFEEDGSVKDKAEIKKITLTQLAKAYQQNAISQSHGVMIDKNGNAIKMNQLDDNDLPVYIHSDVLNVLLPELDINHVLGFVFRDYVAKEQGKGLSANDYTNEDKTKVDAIPVDPKYTDTIPDLSGYAKKEELSNKIDKSQITDEYSGKSQDKVVSQKGIAKLTDDFNRELSNTSSMLPYFAMKEEIPKKLSQLENDKTFKTEAEIQELINNSTKLKKEVVTSLPATGKDDVIYLVNDDKGKENNNYLEYLWLNDKYELIGSTQVDLSGYAKLDDITASKVIDKYTLTKDFRTALSEDQEFLKAIKRDMLTLVVFGGNDEQKLIEQAGFESILYYKGQTIGICLVPTGDIISPDFVKQNQFKPNETYITSDLMKDYNQVIQEQFVDLQSSLKQYVKNCLNRKLNVADIREFTQQELEEAFR